MSTPPNEPAPIHSYIRQPLSDLNSRAVLAVVIAGAVAVVDIVLLTVAFHNNSARAAYENQVVQAAYTELQDYRADQRTKLSTYRPSPNVPGTYTIPIDLAMDLYARQQAAPAREAP